MDFVINYIEIIIPVGGMIAALVGYRLKKYKGPSNDVSSLLIQIKRKNDKINRASKGGV